MKLLLSEFFHWHIVAGLCAVAVLWAWDLLRLRSRRNSERRKETCPCCGAISHPQPGAIRVRCRACGLLFETGEGTLRTDGP